MLFEWNKRKAQTNKRKHGVNFDEAQTVFTDDFSIQLPDSEHSDDEDRLILMGMSKNSRVLVVVYTERFEKIRLISARKATLKEGTEYEQYTR
jgi:uncharacterized DUF497 family protein